MPAAAGWPVWVPGGPAWPGARRGGVAGGAWRGDRRGRGGASVGPARVPGGPAGRGPWRPAGGGFRPCPGAWRIGRRRRRRRPGCCRNLLTRRPLQLGTVRVSGCRRPPMARAASTTGPRRATRGRTGPRRPRPSSMGSTAPGRSARRSPGCVSDGPVPGRRPVWLLGRRIASSCMPPSVSMRVAAWPATSPIWGSATSIAPRSCRRSRAAPTATT